MGIKGGHAKVREGRRKWFFQFFFAVSSLFDTTARSCLNCYFSSELFEPLDNFYALSLSFISDFISGVTQGLCLGGMIMGF